MQLFPLVFCDMTMNIDPGLFYRCEQLGYLAESFLSWGHAAKCDLLSYLFSRHLQFFQKVFMKTFVIA